MKTTSVSDFRSNLKYYLDAVTRDYDNVVINRGSTGAVLISLDEYNAIKGTESVLASERLSRAVQEGIEAVSRGDVVEVDIDAL
ncbi:MAG: type II toxin-antitoxin system Phd/YefM family antitoxin [Bacteroidales bacterium]|nr:type II toxin-antitoxin system Phd/YefM family antitoxin [Bacteroidales bacterium]